MGSTAEGKTPTAYVKHHIHFVLGGLAATTASLCTNPVDVMKTRLQSQGEGAARGLPVKYRGFSRGMLTVVQEEGVLGLWRGVTASALRESTYSTIRIGCYEPFRMFFSGGKKGKDVDLWRKVLAGACAGILGSVITTPTDLVKVRMQADLNVGGQRRYRNTFSAFGVIYREGGLKALYKGPIGAVANSTRAGLATCSQLPTYDHTKHLILKHGWMEEGLPLHAVCSLITGVVVVVATSPVDVIKTRMMNNVQPYSGFLDCIYKTAKNEGLYGFYKGAFPNYLRLGPHTFITFIVWEQLRRLFGANPV